MNGVMKMNEKKYQVIIINNNDMTKMLVSGYGKKQVEKKVLDVLFKSNGIKDLTKVDIYIKQVIQVGDEYFDVE